MGGITLGIGNIGSYSISDMTVWLPLLVGVVGAVTFSYRQLHLDIPFLDIKILKNKEFMLSVIGSMLLYFIMMGSSVIMPLYVQSIMGYSATVSGLVTFPGSLSMAIISPFAGKIFDKLGIKKLFVAGAVFMVISSVGMYLITMNTPIYISAIYNVIRCVAIGCLMMPLVTWGTSYVKESSIADATALLTSLRTIAGAIGSAVFVGIMSFIQYNSASIYGKNSNIHGLNITFIFMAGIALVLFFVAVFLVKEIRIREYYDRT